MASSGVLPDNSSAFTVSYQSHSTGAYTLTSQAAFSGGAKPGPAGARAPAFKGRAPAVPRRMKSGEIIHYKHG